MNECAAFNAFIDQQLGDDLSGLTLEEALVEFRAYQHEQSEVQKKVKIALDQSARGESRPLDDAQFWARVDARLDEQGVPE